MKMISSILTGLLFFSLAAMAQAQSLADLAKKEAERRKSLKTDAKVITNDQADKYKGAAVTTGTPAPAPPSDKTATGESKGDAAATEQGVKPAADEPVDFQGRPESYWKQTFADARQKVKDLENEANVIILKLNDLQNRFYREDNGYKQQEIQREIQKTIYEQDANKESLAQAKADLAALEVEARKSGALPGWIK